MVLSPGMLMRWSRKGAVEGNCSCYSLTCFFCGAVVVISVKQESKKLRIAMFILVRSEF